MSAHTLIVTSHSITLSFFFFFNDTATTEIYTLSLHDALPISSRYHAASGPSTAPAWSIPRCSPNARPASAGRVASAISASRRSEEHTSELQSQSNLVCRLLLEKKKKKTENHEGARPASIERTE